MQNLKSIDSFTALKPNKSWCRNIWTLKMQDLKKWQAIKYGTIKNNSCLLKCFFLFGAQVAIYPVKSLLPSLAPHHSGSLPQFKSAGFAEDILAPL